MADEPWRWQGQWTGVAVTADSWHGDGDFLNLGGGGDSQCRTLNGHISITRDACNLDLSRVGVK